MATTELLHSVRSMRPEERLVAMAVTVLMDRIQKLSDDDRNDLLALLKELTKAKTAEERDEIADTMLEIFEARPSPIRAMDFTAKRPEALEKWSEFVGKKVRDAREAHPMTQDQLSEATGLPQPHISRIENGKLSPSRVTLEKIAAALGKTVEDFDCISERSPE